MEKNKAKERIIEILVLFERIFSTYLDVYFIEVDKGTSLYYNDFEMFNKLNERNKHNLKVLSDLLNRKDKLVKDLIKEYNIDYKINFSGFIDKFFPEYGENVKYWKKRFENLLNATMDINSKNIILLNTTTQVMKQIYNSLIDTKKTKYDAKGNISKNIDIYRFHAQV